MGCNQQLHYMVPNEYPRILQGIYRSRNWVGVVPNLPRRRGNHTFDCPSCPSPMAPPPPIYPSPMISTPTQYIAPNAPRPPPAKKQKVEHCILFNKHNGACPYGNRCSYPHKCATCGTLGHPTTQCHLRLFNSQ